MSNINWREVAESNGLTPEQFKKEIFTVACALGTMDLDGRNAEEDEALRFTCADQHGKIELFVRRVASEEGL